VPPRSRKTPDAEDAKASRRRAEEILCLISSVRNERGFLPNEWVLLVAVLERLAMGREKPGNNKPIHSGLKNCRNYNHY
jgi:hypothetical protein